MSGPLDVNAALVFGGAPWSSLRVTNVTVGTSATAFPTTAFADRKGLYLFNTGTVNVFLGDADVDASVEPILFPSQGLFLPVSDAVVIYGRVASGSPVVIVWEYAV